MKTAVLYMRMSTDKQDNSIESQEQLLRRYAGQHKITIVESYADRGISGRKADKRPAFLQMIEDSERGGFDTVLIYDSSRFARNLEESLVYKSALKRNGVSLVSITEPTPDDDSALLTDAMLGALNEMYSRKLSKAVKRGMVYKAQKGAWQVAPPFGYILKNGVVSVVKSEADIVRQMFTMFTERPAYYSVAVKLRDLNILTRRGNLWRKTDVRRILNNKAYIGYVNYCGEYYKGTHQPIVDEALFTRVQEQIAAIPKARTRPAGTYKHWMSGLLKCAYCGSSMNFHTNAMGYSSYRCSDNSAGRCKYGNMISIPKLERLMLFTLEQVEQTNNLSQYGFFVPKQTPQAGEIDSLKAALPKLEQKLLRVKNAYKNGIDTLEEYKENKQEIFSEIDKVNRQIISLAATEPTEEDFKALRLKISETYNLLKSGELSIEEKNTALRTIVSKAVLDKYKGELTVFYFL